MRADTRTDTEVVREGGRGDARRAWQWPRPKGGGCASERCLLCSRLIVRILNVLPFRLFGRDHPYTNYHTTFDEIRKAGYFLELLGSPFDCFDAEQYGALLLVDSEEEFSASEKEKLRKDMTERGLSLVVFAEWYHVNIMKQMRFFDDNTHSYWTPPTGGANIPALNDLLAPFGVAFEENALMGNIMAPGGGFQVASGTSIGRFPSGGWIHRANGLQDQSVNFKGGRRKLRDVTEGGHAMIGARSSSEDQGRFGFADLDPQQQQ